MNTLHLTATGSPTAEKVTPASEDAALLNEMVIWLVNQRMRHELSVASKDPAIARHIIWLARCQRLLEKLGEGAAYERINLLEGLLAEIVAWMDRDLGEWDSKFIAKIKKALAP